MSNSRELDLPDSQRWLDLSVSIHAAFLSELGHSATPDGLWSHVLAVSGEG